ncbi:CBS domain-containing protein [Fulvivirga sp. M361]|uniref:CBS domain-containing protein n=1 Tax=Fulvivirga sp. M361 TaxID=2594266 RepID=UPI001179BE0B|nr:CBS domain-containing protein [Fulvivirga sp. M361]TRX59894.1 CBS domain-containing protein [Fulvivirga sp. M361]
MVKSFQGVRQVKPVKAQPQDISVDNYMSRQLITFSPDDTMDKVIKVLLDKKIAGGPVVDENKQLVGVISEGDCLKEVVKGKYNNTPSLSGRVSDHMSKEVKTVPPEMNIFEVAQLFLTMKLRRFPVLKEGKLVGQISQKDVMRAVQKLKNATW